MQAQLIDKKLAILYDKYRDRHFAANAQKEVEDIRRTALKVGAATTAGAFILNEVSRLTMRSRKSHIIIFSVLSFVLLSFARNLSSQPLFSYFQVEGSQRDLLVGGSYTRQQILL
jgi:hypothetical protein